jgi:hypothetical protein
MIPCNIAARLKGNPRGFTQSKVDYFAQSKVNDGIQPEVVAETELLSLGTRLDTQRKFSAVAQFCISVGALEDVVYTLRLIYESVVVHCDKKSQRERVLYVANEID